MSWRCGYCSSSNKDTDKECYVCGCPRKALSSVHPGRGKKAVLLTVILVVLAMAGVCIGYICLSGNSISSFLKGSSEQSSEPQTLNTVFQEDNGSVEEGTDREKPALEVPTGQMETIVASESQEQSDYIQENITQENTTQEIAVQGSETWETDTHIEEQTQYEFTIPAYGTSYIAMVYETDDTGLALKTAPDLNAARYLYIPENTPIVIDQIGSGWGHTYYNGLAGWVALKYTRVVEEYQAEAPTGGFIEPTTYVVVNTYDEGLELRLSPTEYSSTFGPMMDGEIITVEAFYGQWAYGSYKNRYGWAYSGYLREY